MMKTTNKIIENHSSKDPKINFKEWNHKMTSLKQNRVYKENKKSKIKFILIPILSTLIVLFIIFLILFFVI